MSPSTQYALCPLSSSPPSPNSSLSPHSPRHSMLNATPPHDDFLGSASQDSNDHDLNTSLVALNFADQYSFDHAGDEGLSSTFTTYDTDSVYPCDYPYWQSVPSPEHSLLLASGPALLSPPTSTLQLDETYYDSPLYSTSSVARNVPQIHIATEGSFAAPRNNFDYSPYSHSQSPHAYSPSVMLSTPYPHSSPSSSNGPYTPESTQASVSPWINHPMPSPVSPVSPSVGQPTTFDHKDIFPPREVLDIAHAAGYPNGGPLVPQKTYKPHTISDRRRYVDEVELEQPIMFFSNNPIGCGIPLRDAIASRFSALEGRDDSMFEGRGPSVSIRLNWPGYAPWSRQIPTRDFRSPPQPITRAKLARNVAKTVQRFIQEMENQQMEEPSEARWRVGTRAIRLEDLILVGLQHVSMGSWQAHVRLVQRHS